jgi:hypothetical protein
MKEDILKALASMDEYFKIDKLKSDFFKAITMDFHGADLDTDFDAIDSIIVPVIGIEKNVIVNRDDIFIKLNKGSIEYYIPEILSPIPELLSASMWFSMYIKEKETDEHPKLMAAIGYNEPLVLHRAFGYEPDKK